MIGMRGNAALMSMCWTAATDAGTAGAISHAFARDVGRVSCWGGSSSTPQPMSDAIPVIPAALSAAEWNGVLSQKDGLTHLREQFGRLPFSPHAIAALLLYEQPFGFTEQDVTDEREVSEYCAMMSAQHRDAGNEATAAKFDDLGMRHRERAEKIAALLPPVAVAEA
jgi:hypothetical protein